MIEKILVAEDDPTLQNFLVTTLRRMGFEVGAVSNGEEAIAKLQEGSFDLVITDFKMPKKNGLDVLRAAKSIHPQIIVIVATAFATIETAVEAMKEGAFNVLIKPFSPEILEINVQKAQEEFKRSAETTFYREEKTLCPKLIAESPAMQKIGTDLEKIAKSQATVFITGESGTGKEVIAAAIHRLSPRHSQPFIKVNCAAIPEALVESEFFGHERGAFTGAMGRKTGRFELADQGTLLLDEVTEIPLSLQAKLLRAIQEQEFERVGGTRSLKVNVRILATSNRLMQDAIESKIFREDLYYRLNVVPIHLPPLRQRVEDILPLADHFLRKCCLENHKPKKSFTQKAMQKLLAYHWPGNVRELANIIERTVVLDFDPIIDHDHLYLDAVAKPIPSSSGITLHAMEKKLILETLDHLEQNRTKTAAMLGISVRTLRNKLHEYGVMGSDEG
jgi:two-component system, NtrC family, response regulator AtoC